MNAVSKKQTKKTGSRIAPIVTGAILVLCCMIPVSSNLFGQTGYITEITRVERIGGRLDVPGQPNAYKWHVGYKFKMKNGELETGSVTVQGDAISSKSGLRAGSSIRYLAFYPRFNTPGEGGFDGNTIMYALLILFGVWMITLGVRKEKPPKTPVQRSREYRAAKTTKENQSPSIRKKPAGRVKAAQAPQPEPDWDSFEYDDETPITDAEADELYRLATEEEVEEEFDLINATDEGAAFYRKVLAIVRWRRANGR